MSRPMIAFLLISVLLLLIANRYIPLNKYAILWTAPIIDVLQMPSHLYADGILWFEDQQRLQQYVQKFEELQQKHNLTQQRLMALEQEHKHILQLLKIDNINGFDWHAARIIGRTPDSWNSHLVLAAKNVQIDDILVSELGLVGVVSEISGQHAIARSILDVGITVPVTDSQKQLHALLRGQGEILAADFIAMRQAPLVGSLLFSSGAGGMYPPGLPVAKVVQVRPRAGTLFADVRAMPIAKWNTQVFIGLASRRFNR
ncbi:MAG: rod shape-determining protein MreC [Mariprofundales bacterium]